MNVEEEDTEGRGNLSSSIGYKRMHIMLNIIFYAAIK